MADETRGRRRQWRDYRSPAGRQPVKEFFDGLSDEDAAAVAAAMRDVLVNGLAVARHLRGHIYEVRAGGDRVIYRVLFATEGRYSQVFWRSRALRRRPRRPRRRPLTLPRGAWRAGARVDAGGRRPVCVPGGAILSELSL
jgi:hypothetical protein